MPLNIKVELTGIQRARREFTRLQDRISDSAPFWRSVAIPIIKRELRETFAQEGPGWQPLALSTLRSRLYPGLPILQQTGALMDSIVNNPVIRISQNELTYGTVNPYAQYHEQGTSRMPARSFLGPATRASMREIRQKYVTYITRQLLQNR